MNVTMRPLATAFDTPTGPTSVATPSCCCCCCCCVNTIVGVTTFTAAEAFHQAQEHRRPIMLSVLAAVLLPLLAAFTVWTLIRPHTMSVPIAILGAAGGYLVATAGALLVAGVAARHTVLIALCVTAIALSAFFVELFAALFTAFIIELAFPLAAWAGVAIARGRKKTRDSSAMNERIRNGELPPPWPPEARR